MTSSSSISGRRGADRASLLHQFIAHGINVILGKSFAPIYESVSEKHDDIVFAKINTEDEQELAASFQIRSIPTLMIFREQIVIFSQAGMLPESALEEIITKTRELDMDMVRADIEAQQAKNA